MVAAGILAEGRIRSAAAGEAEGACGRAPCEWVGVSAAGWLVLGYENGIGLETLGFDSGMSVAMAG